MKHVTRVCFVIVAIIHLLPLTGVVGSERLAMLYGFAVTNPNLEIVLRHRAVLFGLLGVFLLYAAFRPAMQPIAFFAALVSVISFLWLAWTVGDYNPQIAQVFTADLIALTALLIGGGAYLMSNRDA